MQRIVVQILKCHDGPMPSKSWARQSSATLYCVPLQPVPSVPLKSSVLIRCGRSPISAGRGGGSHTNTLSVPRRREKETKREGSRRRATSSLPFGTRATQATPQPAAETAGRSTRHSEASSNRRRVARISERRKPGGSRAFFESAETKKHFN